MADNKGLIYAGLAALGLGALYYFRNPIAAEIGSVMDDAQKLVFKAVIPPVAQPYADIILAVAEEQGISAFLIVQIGYRETQWGTSSYLSQLGPAGTGDGGHGRGLMQIDDRSNAAWLAANDWTDPYTNITKGVKILKGKMSFLNGNGSVSGLTDGETVTVSTAQAAKRNVSPGQYPDPRPIAGDALTAAAVSAYNTGEGNVLISLAVGVDPDTTTAAPPYANDVLTRMASVVSTFNAQVA